MISINLPEYEKMERIRVKLENPRQIVFKDGRNASPSQNTLLPLELKEHEGRKGIYIILKDNKVGYVGATTNLTERMGGHNYLRNNSEIKHIFFLEENNKSKRLLLEMFYKFHYFGKVNVEWNYTK